MLLTEHQAEVVFTGSYESKVSALACAASEEGWSLISSNERHIHAIVEGELVKCEYQSGSDGITFGKMTPVVTFPESDAVGMVAERITVLTSKIIAGDPIDKDSLVAISRHAKGFMTPSKAFESMRASEMTSYYEENKVDVRRGIHGRLGEIESHNKLTHFRRMSAARADESRQDILDSLKSCAEALDRLECIGEGKVHDLLTNFKSEAQRASAILRHSGQPSSTLAEAADHFSKSIQTAIILRDYINQEGN